MAGMKIEVHIATDGSGFWLERHDIPQNENEKNAARRIPLCDHRHASADEAHHCPTAHEAVLAIVNEREKEEAVRAAMFLIHHTIKNGHQGYNARIMDPVNGDWVVIAQKIGE